MYWGLPEYRQSRVDLECPVHFGPLDGVWPGEEDDCIDACPGGANYVAPIEATMTARTHLRSIIAALKDLPSVVIADS